MFLQLVCNRRTKTFDDDDDDDDAYLLCQLFKRFISPCLSCCVCVALIFSASCSPSSPDLTSAVGGDNRWTQ